MWVLVPTLKNKNKKKIHSRLLSVNSSVVESQNSSDMTDLKRIPANANIFLISII
jgi:hypothetical protein